MVSLHEPREAVHAFFSAKELATSLTHLENLQQAFNQIVKTFGGFHVSTPGSGIEGIDHLTKTENIKQLLDRASHHSRSRCALDSAYFRAGNTVTGFHSGD